MLHRMLQSAHFAKVDSRLHVSCLVARLTRRLVANATQVAGFLVKLCTMQAPTVAGWIFLQIPHEL